MKGLKLKAYMLNTTRNIFCLVYFCHCVSAFYWHHSCFSVTSIESEYVNSNLRIDHNVGRHGSSPVVFCKGDIASVSWKNTYLDKAKYPSLSGEKI